MSDAFSGHETPKLKNGLCIPHFRGVSLDTDPKFFYDGCSMCLSKLERGLTTRDAGPIKAKRPVRGRR